MPTDYILFNHGVNTREARPEPTYADPLFEVIQRYYNITGRTLKKVALYWGNVKRYLARNSTVSRSSTVR